MVAFSNNKWEASKVADSLSKQLFPKGSNVNKKAKNVRNSGKSSKKKTPNSKSVASSPSNPKKRAKLKTKSTPQKEELRSVHSNSVISEKLRSTKKKKQNKKNKQKTGAEKNAEGKLKQNMKPRKNTDVKEKIIKMNVKKKVGGIDINKLGQLLTATGIDVTADKSKSLRERMVAQLRASRFRYLNETLYTNSSSVSRQMFKEDPEAFRSYHSGYQQQVDQWPLNPLDVIIASIKKMPKDYVIADFGCGEARLAASVKQKVHSFDLVAINEGVTACDMAHTPLLMGGVDVVVFCLSLMGTNLSDYLKEANRVLKKDGILKIAEVESRFDSIDDFKKLLESYGFKNTWSDLSHNLFYFMDFKKITDVNRKNGKLPEISLKPCLYKKR